MVITGMTQSNTRIPRLILKLPGLQLQFRDLPVTLIKQSLLPSGQFGERALIGRRRISGVRAH